MVTEQEIINALPKFNNPRRNWSGLCEAAIWNLFNVLGTGGPSSSSATAARKRSKIEGNGYGPGNNVVWWSGVWGTEDGKSVDFGHVAFHLANGWGFMASSSVSQGIPGFTNIGFVNLAQYQRRFPNMRLEGWSYDHAGSYIKSAPAKPSKPAPTKEEIEEAELMAAKDDIVNALSGDIKALNGRLNDLERSLTERITSVIGVATREGRNARAYENADTGETFIAEPGVFFVSLANDANPQASVDLYAADGWVQNWSDRKVYSTDRFEFVKRQYLRTVAGTQPLPPVENAEVAA